MLLKKLKILPQYLMPQILLTQFMGTLGRWTNRRFSQWAIKSFIKHYGVDMSEALHDNIKDYPNFNSFFIRQLQAEKRPIDGSAHNIVSPVDGTISCSGKINTGQLFQAKGRNYSLHALLAGDVKVCEHFAEGHYCTAYLSPKDYHRVHCPMNAKVTSMTFIPGKLFSVAPTTVDCVDSLFARNERLVIMTQTEIGPMAIIMVGAMIVSGLNTVWHGDIKRETEIRKWCYPNAKTPIIGLEKGQELGHFKMGSTVILLFPNQSMQWLPKLDMGHTVKMGQAIAHKI